MGAAKYQNDGDPRTSGPGFGVTIHPDALALPYRWRQPRVVFVNSMSDLFHAKVPVAFIRDVFDVMRDTPQHTYQILTKRSLRLRRFGASLDWPDNVWMGVSVENTSQLRRVDDLRATPAKVRFLSAEPLLGPLMTPELSLDLTVSTGSSPAASPGPRAGAAHATRSGCATSATSACAPVSRSSRSRGWAHSRKAGGRDLDGRTWNQMPALVVARPTARRSRRNAPSRGSTSARR